MSRARCISGPLEPQFWANVQRGAPDECWEWQGDRGTRGYGRIAFQGRRYRAHRLAYELANGPFPEELHVCHHCDNPPCVNPAHLFVGTQKDNINDMYAKGRWHGEPRRGEAHHAVILTEDKVRDIRRRRDAGESLLSLAREFGVGIGAIYMIAKRKNWKHVPEESAL